MKETLINLIQSQKNYEKLLFKILGNTMVYIYIAGLLVVVGGVVVQVMRQIEFGVKLYLLLHVAVAISN